MEKRYQKSKHNVQCIGPCYKENEAVLHPITLRYITHDKSFCPTNEWVYENKLTGKTDTMYLDECYYAPSKKGEKEKFEQDYLFPKIDIDCGKFLGTYYDITSFESAMEWISEHDYMPLYTKLRIMECSWKSFGLDAMIDDQIVNFYIDIIKKHWIKRLMKKVGKYIHVDSADGTIYLKKNGHKREPKDKDKGKSDLYMTEKVNFLVAKLINNNNIYKFLTHYVATNRENWANIVSHHTLLEKTFMSYMVKKIKDTVS